MDIFVSLSKNFLGILQLHQPKLFKRFDYYHPTTKLLEGNVFSRISLSVILLVCMFTGESSYSITTTHYVIGHMGTPPTPGADPPDQAPPGSDTPQRSACWEIQATSGRYASYWNAVLFMFMYVFTHAFHFAMIRVAMSYDPKLSRERWSITTIS